MTSAISINNKEPSIFIMRDKGLILLVLFIISIGLSQLFEFHLPQLSLFFIAVSFLSLVVILLVGSNADLFFFIFFTTLLRIKLPFLSEREFILFSPILFFTVAILKNFRKITYFEKHYLRNIFILLLLIFFSFMIYTSFRGLVLPAFLGGPSGNSGFLNRWAIFGQVLLASIFLILFKVEYLLLLLKNFYRFYLWVLIISIIIIWFNIGPFPMFNTFTWSLIIESVESKKMIIAGTASIFLMIYILTIKKFNYSTLFLFFLCTTGVLLSGSRSAFIAFFLILFCYFTIKYKAFGKSLLLVAFGSILFFAFTFSPLVLKIPTQFQRLFIIFPSEFYTGEIKELAKSAGASSSSFRFDMWSIAWKDVSENPWLGKGLGRPKAEYIFGDGGMGAFHTIPQKILYHDFMVTGSLHNTYMSLLYLMGFPAMIIFFLLLFGVVITMYRKSLHEPNRNIIIFFLLILLYYLVLSLTSDIYASYEFYMFLTIIIKVMHYSYKIDPSLIKKLN